MRDLFRKAGFESVDFEEKADVYIINTCTVTNTSDIKSKKMIRAAIKRNPDACVVAMGCFIEANKGLFLISYSLKLIVSLPFSLHIFQY